MVRSLVLQCLRLPSWHLKNPTGSNSDRRPQQLGIAFASKTDRSCKGPFLRCSRQAAAQQEQHPSSNHHHHNTQLFLRQSFLCLETHQMTAYTSHPMTDKGLRMSVKAVCGLLVLFAVLLLHASLAATPTLRLQHAQGGQQLQQQSSLQLVLTQPEGPTDQKVALVRALDYRTAHAEVYAPNGYQVCTAADTTVSSQPQCWLRLSKHVDCAQLLRDYQALLETYQPVLPGPRTLPAARRDEFLLQNHTVLSSFYFPQMSHAPDAAVPVWTNSTIQGYVAQATARAPIGSYENSSLPIYQALACYPVAGLTGAVFGSEAPWVEALLFTYGSGHITTIEFRTTISHIPNHQVIKPLQWAKGVLSGELPSVDYAFSFSSWEHDGLGRYGDPVDPWGDVKAVQKAACYVKPGGLLFFGAPASSRDQLAYNAHRIYGPVRLPMLSANWEVLGVFDSEFKPGECGTATCRGLFSRWEKLAPLEIYTSQPVIVLRNLRTTPCSIGA